MDGGSIYFQPYRRELAERLFSVIASQDERLLITMPFSFEKFNEIPFRSRKFWLCHLFLRRNVYRRIPRRRYGNTGITRCGYLRDKDTHFAALRSLWDNKDVVFIEGETSRNGVGNDLYENARSLRRIVCPANDAFSVCDEVSRYVSQTIPRSSLVLLSLGPAAKVIAYDLFRDGFRVIDIGHLDCEYEWFLAGKRYVIPGKHTAEEFGERVSPCTDEKYLSQIVRRFGCE